MYLSKGLLSIVVLFFSIQLFGQPGNDNCPGALISSNALDTGGSCVTISDDNTDATPWELSPGVFFTGNCWGGTVDSVVFYQFTAQGVSVEITVNGPDVPKIALITAPGCDPSAGQEFGCAVGNSISIDNGLAVGTTYYIVIGFQNQAEGPYDICVYNPTNQPNDECDFAIPLTNLDHDLCEISLMDNYYPSTSSNFFPGCWGSTLAEVWFSFQAQGTSIADLHVENAPANAYIAVLDGVCSNIGGMLVLGCGANGTPIMTDNNLVVGQTYYIVVGFENYANGTFNLCLDNPENAFNDDCNDAPVIPSIQLSDEDLCMTSIAGNTINNDYPSTDIGTIGCWNMGDSYNVWYQFVAQGPDLDIEVDPLSFSGAEQIALISFDNNNFCDPGSAAVIECSNGESLTLDNTLTIGNTYYVVVGFENNAYGDYCINVFNPEPPPNDTACAAIPLNTTGGCNSPQIPCPGGADCFTTEYANPDYPNNVFPPDCAPGMQNNVFYTITLDDPENVGFEIDLQEGTASNLNMMLLQFNDCNQQFDILFTYCGVSYPVEYGPVEPGEVYYLIVGTSEEDEGTFDICVDEIPPCFENNYCEDLTGGMSNAEDIGVITTFDPAQDCTAGGSDDFTCVEGCNLFADPEPGLTACLGDNDPVVWYQFTTDFQAGLLNMTITSDDFAAPSVQLWSSQDGTCNSLQLEGLTGENFSCLVGSQGQLVANSTPVNVNTTYYLAIGGVNTFGGDFELCIATVTQQAACVTASSYDVVSRSFGGSLDGPFFPGEQLRICLNVENFQISGANNCQWFQGIVPVFGAGWDPSSFDGDGQPMNATMNGSPFPAPNIYNSGTFDWWTSVSYHHPHCYYNVGDFDGNGTLDMCNSQYDPDCEGPGLSGSNGLGACWYDQDPGDFLPGGWFTSGVNGSCTGSVGYPGVDWGDGGTCSGSSGPWNFCFDLTTRTDCNDDPSYSDLTIGFISFADGEVGSWDGSASICGQDEPLFQKLPMCCNELTDISESMDPICSGGVFAYTVDGSGVDDNVDFWEWTVDQGDVTGANPGSGPNGTVVIDNLVNNTTSTQYVTYNFLGFAGGECPAIILTVDIEVHPEIEIQMSPYLMCATPNSPYLIEPNITGGSGNFDFEWNDQDQTATANLSIDNPVDGTNYTLVVTDQLTGCEGTASITLDVYTTFPVDIIPSSTEQCEQSGTIGLSVTASGGTGVFNQYEWTTPGGGSGSGQSYDADISGQYLVEVIDDQGCVGKDSIQLQFFEAPTVDLIVEDPFICPDRVTQIFSTVEGGQGPYLYEWDDGTSTSFNAAEIPGTYTLLVTDNNGCTSTASVQVGAADVPDVDLGTTQQICVGADLPELSLEGQGPFVQIIWSTGVIGAESITITEPGMYSVTVINDEGCQNSAEVDVSFFPEPVLDLPDTLSFCQGQGVFFNAFDPQWVQYDWQHISGSDNDADIFISNPGVYSLIVYDANGCEAEDEIEIIESEFLTPVISGDRTICAGETGIYTIDEYFSMEWTDLEGTLLSDSAALWVDTAGTYILNITDFSGCPGIDTFEVSVSDPSVFISGPATICTDAVATLDAGPGYASYLWSDGSTTQSIQVDTGGMFAVTVTDMVGCAVSDTIEIVETDLIVEITGDTAICTSESTILDAGPNFETFAWSNGETTQTIQVDTGGTYTVTVTDILGCEAIDQVTVDEFPTPAPVVTGDRMICAGETGIYTTGQWSTIEWSDLGGNVLSDSASLHVDTAGIFVLHVVDGVGCPGRDTFEVTVSTPSVSITGPSTICAEEGATLDAGPGFDAYLWSDGSTTQTLQIDTGGLFAVTVTDMAGCTATDVIDIAVSDPDPEITGDTAVCSDAIAILDAGSNYVSYAWSTGLPDDTLQMVAVSNPGMYTVSVTDQFGCEGVDSIEVTHFPDPVVQVSGDMDFCVGGVAMLNGGSGFVSYAWSTSDPGDTTQLISVNAAGTYTVTVTDMNGCSATGEMTVNPPYQETMDISGSLTFCTGSSTTLDAGPNYVSYAWSTGDDTPTIEVTSGGQYAVTVVDANGCIASDMVMVDESDELTPDIMGDTAMCQGTPIQLTVGNSYTSVEWSNSETTPTITVTSGGTYFVTVTDAGGCTGTDVIQVEENIQPSATVTPTAVICNDPADGSVIDFAALITAGETTGDWTDLNGTGVDLSDLTAVDFDGIDPGIYAFQYSTNSAVAPCEDQDYIVQVTVLDCACPNVQVNPAGEICNDGGTLDLDDLFQPTTETGGTWSLVSTPGGSQPVSLNGSVVDVTGADAGDYTFKYTAPNINLGCPDTSFTTLTVSVPPNPGVVIESVMLCIGEDRIVNLTQLISGADPGGTWTETSAAASTGGAFNPNTATFRTVDQASALYTFEYSLVGPGSCADASTTVEVMIEPLPLADAGAAEELTCDNQEVTLSGTGSSQGAAYIYTWSTQNGGAIQDGNSLTPRVNAPGTYILTVQNSLTGCVQTDSVEVFSNQELPTDLDYAVDAPLCAGEGSASLEIFEVFNGTPPYTYSLNGGQQTSDVVFDNLAPGSYELTVEDANGCQYTTSFAVPEPNALEIQIDGELFIEEGDTLKLSYNFFSTNSPAPDSIIWKTEDDPAFCINCPSIAFVPATDAGEIIVEAYDENGCKATASVIFRVAFERIAYVPNVFTPNDDNLNDRFTIYVNEGGATVLDMQIYTRWGEQVFGQENFDPNVPELGWDGRVGSGSVDPGSDQAAGDLLLPGVYVYYIRLLYSDGIEEVIKGDITLLR